MRSQGKKSVCESACIIGLGREGLAAIDRRGILRSFHRRGLGKGSMWRKRRTRFRCLLLGEFLAGAGRRSNSFQAGGTVKFQNFRTPFKLKSRWDPANGDFKIEKGHGYWREQGVRRIDGKKKRERRPGKRFCQDSQELGGGRKRTRYH